jgi:hypothetical protein
MKKAIVTLESISNYSQSRHYDVEEVPKLEQELPKDYEKRTWRNRLHVSKDGFVQMPPMAFKNCLSEAAKYRGDKIPNKRGQTYTKHFESGILVVDPLTLPVKASDVAGEWLFVPSDGIRGSGKRVDKCFPLIPSWSGEVTYYVLDPLITEEPFFNTLQDAGDFIGLGRFRPSRNGFYGRFKIAKRRWED